MLSQTTQFIKDMKSCIEEKKSQGVSSVVCSTEKLPQAAKSSQASFLEVSEITQKNNESKFTEQQEKEILEYLSLMAQQLKITVDTLASSKLKPYVHLSEEQKSREREKAFGADSVGGRIGRTNPIKKVKSKLIEQSSLIQIVQYATSMLIDIESKNTNAAIDSVIQNVDAAIACEICETLPSTFAKYVFARRFLLHFSISTPAVEQSILCRFVNSLAQSEENSQADYGLALRTSLPDGEEAKPETIYLSEVPGGLKYDLIGPDNRLMNGTISWNTLTETVPPPVEEIIRLKDNFLPTILEQTSIAGHTPDKNPVFAVLGRHNNNSPHYECLALAIWASKEMRPKLLENKKYYQIIAAAISKRFSDEKLYTTLPSLFKDWCLEDIDKAFFSVAGKNEQWIQWAILSCPQVVAQMSEEVLKSYVEKLDLNYLSNSQIKLMDKKVRIAFLKSLGTWENGKAKLGRDVISIGQSADALTHDFNLNDIEQLEGYEAGLVASFKKNIEKVTAIITDKDKANDAMTRKMAWNLLQELNKGFLNGDTRRVDKTIIHRLMVTSVYHYSPSADYGYILEVNDFIKKELYYYPNKFRDGATLPAFKVILSHPEIINRLDKNQELSSYLKKAALLGFSPSDLWSFFKPSFSPHESVNVRNAKAALLKGLPAFLESNREFSKDEDVTAILELHTFYRQSNPMTKIESVPDYNQDSIIAALLKNQSVDKARALGPVIFSEAELLKGYFKQKENYQVLDFGWVRELKIVLKAMAVAITINKMFDAGSFFIHEFNPLNWKSRSSPGQTNAAYASAAVVAVCAASLGGGVSSFLAGLFVPIILGGVGFLVGGLIMSSFWKGIKKLKHWIKEEYNRSRGQLTIDESKAILKIIEHGLSLGDSRFFLPLLCSNETFRENVAKTLSSAYDDEFDINDREAIAYDLRKLLIYQRDNYRYSERYPNTRLFVNLSAVMAGVYTLGVSWILGFIPPFFIKYRAEKLLDYQKRQLSSSSRSSKAGSSLEKLFLTKDSKKESLPPAENLASVADPKPTSFFSSSPKPSAPPPSDDNSKPPAPSPGGGAEFV